MSCRAFVLLQWCDRTVSQPVFAAKLSRPYAYGLFDVHLCADLHTLV